jgi:thiol-disulfide isomerase/thioredoxin
MSRIALFSLLIAVASPTIRPAHAADDLLIPEAKRVAARKFSLRDIEGKKHQLVDLKGKVVVVNFWATWCGPCQKEMPAFTKIYAEYRDRGVEIVGAANEERSAKNKVQAFVKSMEIQFPIWLEATADHMEAFGVGPELPATAIIDAQGRLAVSLKGVTDEAQLRSLLDRLLPGTAASSAGSSQPAAPPRR